MKILLLLLLLIPVSSYADTPEAYYFVGRINGHKITLDYIDMDASAWGSKNTKYYNYCSASNKSESSAYYLSCSLKKGGKELVYYEADKTGNTYICKSGCTKHVVKKFKMLRE